MNDDATSVPSHNTSPPHSQFLNEELNLSLSFEREQVAEILLLFDVDLLVLAYRYSPRWSSALGVVFFPSAQP